MNKLPAFQFYPGDWMSNVKLRRCSHAARGAWMDVLCILHDSDEYGLIRWPLVDLAQATNAPIKLLRELVEKEVLKGSDKGCEAFIYTPRHSRKDGDPVTLIEATKGPLWFSSRLVKDAYLRKVRGTQTRFKPPLDAGNTSRPNTAPKRAPKGTLGGTSGDGSSSSSSSSIPPNPLSPSAGGMVARGLDQIKLPPNLDNPSGRSLVESFAAIQGRWSRFDPISFQATMKRLGEFDARKAMGFLSAWIEKGRFETNYRVNWEEYAPAEKDVPRVEVNVVLNREPKVKAAQ